MVKGKEWKPCSLNSIEWKISRFWSVIHIIILLISKSYKVSVHLIYEKIYPYREKCTIFPEIFYILTYLKEF